MDAAIISLTTKFNGWGMVLFVTITCAISGVLTVLIGLERELKGQPAGLRTHVITSIACCALTTISIYAIKYAIADYSDLNYDASRIAAGILSGIGFMGAGAIIKSGISVRGLTTAATLLLCSAIGMACGSGFILEAIIVTFISLLFLVSLSKIEKYFDKITPCIVLTVDKTTPIVNKIREAAEKCSLPIKNIGLKSVQDGDEEYREISVYFPFWAGNVYLLDFQERFASQPFVKKITTKNIKNKN